MLNPSESVPSSFGKSIFWISAVCLCVNTAQAQTLVSAPNSQPFGQVAVSGTSTATQVLGYTFSGTGTPAFSLAYGSEFTLGSPKCTGSGSVTCTISISFLPRWPGLRQDAVLVKDSSGNLISTTLLNGTGQGAEIALYPGVISTLAGTGTWGYSGDGGLARTASFRNPQGVAIDGFGNLFIADSVNQVVRKVSAKTGIVTTVAGTGAAGYSGDGGLALKAALNNPVAIALDGAGNLYIADQGNNLIRKVSAATQQIVTVAGGGNTASGSDGIGDGGLATQALLSSPGDVAVDAAGDLFIADSFNGLIRRVDATSGKITVVAGGGNSSGSDGLGDGGPATSAWLHNPTGVAVDATGNLYIADTGNSMVRRVDASSGVITVVTAAGGYSSSAQLASPVCVRLDAAGNLYISDQVKNVVRQVMAQSGIITTIAGTGAPGYSGDNGSATGAALRNPAGLALDPAGNVYVADLANNVIREISKPNAMAFPNTLVGEASQPQTLTVLNIGDQPLNFSGVTTTTNFSQPQGFVNCSSSTALPAAAACMIAVEFAPTTSGSFNGTLALSDNSLSATTATQTIALTGTATVGSVPQLSFAPAGLTFATHALGTVSSAQSITLSNTGSAPLSLSSIQLAGANAVDFSFSGTTCQMALAAKSSCSISVVFSPSATGVRTASLIFSDNLANSPQTVVVTGTAGTAQLALSSSALVFNSQTVGTTSPAKIVTLSNSGSAPLSIVSMALAGANAGDFGMTSTCGAAIPAGASCSVSVICSPSVAGARSASLSIVDSLASSPQVVTITGTGAAGGTADNGQSHYYAGVDQHVHELYIAANAWHDRDLTAAAGGPNVAATASITTLVDTLQNLLRVNYAGADQHLHELYSIGGAWYDCDLTAAAHGPNLAAGAAIANLVDTTQNLLRINYAGVDQHLHELYISGGAWHDCDLTAAAGGSNLAAGAAIANLVDTTQNLLRINYAGADQHLHELFIAGGGWHDCDLTSAGHGPEIAAGSAIANLVDTTQNLLRINYVGVDQHLHELFIAGAAWYDCDLTAAAAGPEIAATAAIANLVDSTQNVLRINYAGADQHLHELYVAGGAWHDCDLTTMAAGLKIPAGGLMENVVDTIANTLRVNYLGADSQVHELYIAGGAWHDCDLTAAAAGPLAAVK